MIEPLPDLMVKEDLTKDEVLQCKQIIFGLLQLEAKHEALPVPSLAGGGRGGGKSANSRRDEHYKLLWSELESFLRGHSASSDGHAEVLGCLLEVRNKDENKVELDQALRELDR